MTMYSLSKLAICFCIMSLGLMVYQAAGQLPSPSVSCKTKPVLFVFGDSNSDTGGSNSAQGETDSYPNGRAFPTIPSDRFSDGRVIVDFMCENLTVSYLSAYMNSMVPNFTNGVNFAVAGSATVKTTFSLQTQIKQLKRFHNLSLELPMKGYKNLLVQEDFQNALYVIDIGQNDLSYALAKFTPSMETTISDSIAVIKEAIMAIYNLGGRYFWIHNTGPLGCLPWHMAFNKVNNSDFDEHGCIRSRNDVAKAFNSQLETLCQEIRVELTDATVVFVDIYSIKYDMYAYHDAYGFIKPQKACCESCLSIGKIGSYICKESARYISWDGVHYTEAANKLVASKIFSENFSKPPLPFNFFCNN